MQPSNGWPLRRLIVPVIGASLLSACAAGGSSVVCPPVVEYSPEIQAQAAEELAALPEGAVIEAFMLDYGRLRAQARACAS